MDETAARPRVLIVEDHAVLAEGLGLVLAREGYEVETTGAGASAEDVLARAGALQPDVVVLDLHLGGSIGDSFGLVGPLGDGGAVVLVLTGEEDPAELGACLEAGASGLAAKNQALDAVTALVGRALDGKPLITDERRNELMAALRHHRAEEKDRLGPFAELTPREQAVLVQLMEGRSAEAVAAASFVALTTVRSQIRAILQKLGVRTQLQAVAMARNAGWFPPHD